MLRKLNFPDYSFSFRENKGIREIFDPFRRKFVKLNPEEWVRQHLLQYLVVEKKYPQSLISVESSLVFNQQKKRCDALVYNQQAKAMVLIECKSYDVALSQSVLEQIARYNFTLQLPYLLISNGLQHYMMRCQTVDGQHTIDLMQEIPLYTEL